MGQSYGWSDAGREVAAAYPAFNNCQREKAIADTARVAEATRRAAMQTWVAGEIHRVVGEFWSIVYVNNWSGSRTPYYIPLAGEVNESVVGRSATITFYTGQRFWTKSDGTWGFDYKGGSDYNYDDHWTRFGFSHLGFVWNQLADESSTVNDVKRRLAAWLMAKGLPLPS